MRLHADVRNMYEKNALRRLSPFPFRRIPNKFSWKFAEEIFFFFRDSKSLESTLLGDLKAYRRQFAFI